MLHGQTRSICATRNYNSNLLQRTRSLRGRGNGSPVMHGTTTMRHEPTMRLPADVGRVIWSHSLRSSASGMNRRR